jgi:hypothetical protein
MIREAVGRLRRRLGKQDRIPDPPPPSAPPPPVALSSFAKQAVIIVHGMGEQRPMDTLKGFVRTVWEDASGVAATAYPRPKAIWSKPDNRTGSLELRRITTRESIGTSQWPGGVRTDFYELYWADLTAGSTWGQFVAWVRYLLWRRWSNVPSDVKSAWLALWVISALVLLLSVIAVLPGSAWHYFGRAASWRWLFVLLAAALLPAIHNNATRTFGRVVRYTRAEPDNIAARAAVRQRGLELLRALHDGDEYSRVVVVAHSLGTILAHDLIGYFWAERTAARTVAAPGQEFSALCAVEEAAAALDAARGTEEVKQSRSRYRDAQARLRRLLAGRPTGDKRRWLISDLITLGSPLTHSEFLIASSMADLESRKAAREIPIAPPYREPLDQDVFEAAKAHGLPVAATAGDSGLMCFPDPADTRRWILHHAAPFAAVRWTNVHDPARFVYQGDLIGGPLADILGPAIEDIDLRTIRGQASVFSHTLYWQAGQDPRQLDEVRRAVNILDA